MTTIDDAHAIEAVRQIFETRAQPGDALWDVQTQIAHTLLRQHHGTDIKALAAQARQIDQTRHHGNRAARRAARRRAAG